MEVQFYGANCVRLSGKKFSIVVDDNLDKLGMKSVTKPTDISLRTSKLVPKREEVKFSADLPGEYEISGAIIHGIAARGHMDEKDKKTAVIYTVESDEVRVAVLGHIYPELSDEQVESIGAVNAIIVPVGGNGYTLDGAGALQLIKKIEPSIVIPTHYEDKAIKYEVPQADLTTALKNMGMEVHETVAKIKITPAELSDNIKLVVLERQ